VKTMSVELFLKRSRWREEIRALFTPLPQRLPSRPMTEAERAAEGRRLDEIEPHSSSLLTNRIRSR